MQNSWPPLSGVFTLSANVWGQMGKESELLSVVLLFLWRFLVNQKLLILTPFFLYSCKLSSKNQVSFCMIMLTGWPAYPTALFWICLFISERKFSPKVEMKRFPHHGTWGFSAVCLWKVFNKGLGFSPFWGHNLTLGPFTLEGKASTNVSISPCISASS